MESLAREIFLYTPESIHSQLLLRLPKVLGQMKHPFYFSEYVLKCLKKQNSSIEEQILSLNCLLVLMGRFSFECEDYYARLYEVLRQALIPPEWKRKSAKESQKNTIAPLFSKTKGSLFQNKYTSKFLKILEVSLRSNHLSTKIVCSFVKILLKHAMFSPPAATIKISFLLYNMAQNNSTVYEKLRMPTIYDPATHDTFDVEAEIFENGAEGTLFWEAEILRRHYLGDVRRVFEMMLRGGSDGMECVEMERFSELDDVKILKRRLKRVKRME